MESNERGIVIVSPDGLGRTMAMEMAIEAFKEHGVLVVETDENRPSPFDPEPMPFTNPYKDLLRVVKGPIERTKRNTNITPPKKKRKRK